MTKYQNIHIIGAGGIGSYFCEYLYKSREFNQFSKKIDIHVYDSDEVEDKNLSYQNYTAEDLFLHKVTVMSSRYNFLPHRIKVEKLFFESKTQNDLIVCCVDNAYLRKELYTSCIGEKKPYFLDLRSEGRFISYWAKHPKNTLEKLLSTLGDASETGGSCQLAHRFEKQVIDYGNQIISIMGLQILLNHLRGETFASSLVLQI